MNGGDDRTSPIGLLNFNGTFFFDPAVIIIQNSSQN
jgi:hypothetical protein